MMDRNVYTKLNNDTITLIRNNSHCQLSEFCNAGLDICITLPSHANSWVLLHDSFYHLSCRQAHAFKSYVFNNAAFQTTTSRLVFMYFLYILKESCWVMNCLCDCLIVIYFDVRSCVSLLQARKLTFLWLGYFFIQSRIKNLCKLSGEETKESVSMNVW